MNRSLALARTRKDDVRYTPIKLARKCIAAVSVKPSDVLYDPFKGTGAFFDNFPSANPKCFSEIDLGLDFFAHTDEVDWIISNPPFSCLTRVLEHCASLCRKGFGLIILSTALTPRRLALMQSNGFTLTKLTAFEVKHWFGFPCLFVLFERTDAPSALCFEAERF